MKVKLFLLVAFSIFILAYSAYPQSWSQLVGNGFGDKHNQSSGATIFNNDLYVGMNNTSTGTQIWRYDGTTWTQVNTDGFGSVNNANCRSIAVFDNYLYVGTGNSTTGTQIWRTQGAGGPPYTDWTQVNTSGFGSANNTGSRAMAVFNNYLYVATNNTSTGTQIWRTEGTGGPPYTDWTQVNTSGFGSVNNQDCRAMAVFNNYLYAGTQNSSTGTQIWRTEGAGGPPYTDWTQVNTSGFGDPNNDISYSFKVDNGYFFVATDNASTGTQIWVTEGEGGPPYTDWTRVNTSGFGSVYNTDSRISILNDYLYVSTDNTFTGTQVWRSQGVGGPPYTDWTQINTNGFGDSNNTFSFLPVFNSTLYAATNNTVTGAQIWEWLEAVNISVGPGSLNFGNVSVGRSPNQTITITNEAISTSNLTGSVGALSAPWSILSGGGPFNLASGQSVTVTVQFSPTTAGAASASLSITHNATNWSSPLTVALSGTGIIAPIISVTPTSENYGNVKVKRSASASFTVTNSGKANLTISSTSITGTDASMFTISGGASKTIKPGKSLTIRVTFKPTSTGAQSATLVITCNDPVTPTCDIALSGTGQ